MAIYVSCLFDTMMKHGTHETIIEHKYRLYKDMVYGNGRVLDDEGRIRLDHFEMDPDIQKETTDLMFELKEDEILKASGTKYFLKTFFEINGFDVEGIDYDKDVDIDSLIDRYLPDGF